jgi:hypothetical protein
VLEVGNVTLFEVGLPLPSTILLFDELNLFKNQGNYIQL